MADLLLRDTDPDEFRQSIVDELAEEIRKLHDAQNGPRLVDRIEMAERAGVGTATLDKLVTEQRIPSVQIGRRRFFSAANSWSLSYDR